jgi:RimJ/RimL family protein N-acetyltransferase
LEGNDGFQGAIVIEGRIAGVIGYTGVDWEEPSTGIGYWWPPSGRDRAR